MDIAALRTALALARRGLAVFPCMPRRKEPATVHGYKDASTDTEIILQWWRERPDCNVAVATGAVSGIFVLDIDGGEAEAALTELEREHGSLPPSVEAITARGRHVWFQYPDRPVQNSAGKVAPGCDIRGDGGYVLAPPSVHPSGRQYAWSVDCAAALAAAPAWLLDKVSTPARGGDATPLPPEQWRELVTGGVGEGARDCTLAKLSGHLLRRRIDPFVVLELLQCWNSTRCRPPLPPFDIERIVNSVCERELRRRTSGR